MLVKLQRLVTNNHFDIPCIVLPKTLFVALALENEKIYTLHAGKLQINATFSSCCSEENNQDPASLLIPDTVLKQLCLYDNMEIQIWKQNSQIYLGPIVGVFLNRRYIQTLEEATEVPIFIFNHMRGNDYSHCVTYFFSIHDIHWLEKKVQGYSFDATDKAWHKKWYPLPDVLYDRGASFNPEHKCIVEYIRQQFHLDKTTKTINSLHYLGKWQLYKTLKKYSLIQPHLPETIEYRTFNDAIEMVDRHAFIFIKSFYGSRGREIITIEKLKKEDSSPPITNYKVTYLNQEIKSVLLNTLDELQDLVESQLNSNKKYIIQQGIRLLQYEGRFTDTRVLTQKNGSGEWQATYNHVNIAAMNSTITTINSDDLSYEEYYQYFCKQRVFIPTDLQIRKLAITIAQIIENEWGPMAEMGLDFAIDKDYQVWFFEANSKPEKYPGPGVSYCDLPTKQFYNILEYAKHLVIPTPSTQEISHAIFILPNETDESAENTSPTISIPKHIHQQLQAKGNALSSAYLRIGQWVKKVFYTYNNSEYEIRIPFNVLNQYPALWNIECHCKLQENTITLGPVISVFLSNGSIRKMNKQTPRFRHYELAVSNQICKTILYYFSIKDVDFVHQRINGTYYDSNDQRWKQKPFPLPEVFYDRGGGVLTNQIVKSDYIREQFKNIPNIKKINPQHYFDKWLTHKKLSKFTEMKPYLPATISYKSITDLRSMFDHHHHLYIKDSFGSNGRGIIKVSKLSEHGYQYSYFSHRVYEDIVPSIEDLHDVIQSSIKSDNLIIQKAISLINIANRNIDLRATVQRKGDGQLDIVSLPVRMGCPYSPITSTQSGSRVYEFYHFFETFLAYSTKEIDHLKQKVEAFLHTSYQCIETSYGIFGEIGIDFALDVEGSIWFIECNAKPGYDAMYKSYDKETSNRAFANPLEYAKFITKYK